MALLMSQHFLMSAKARTLSLATVLRMSDLDAETVFRSVRWEDGKAVCVHCGCPTVYECRRPSGALRFRCKACRKDFSITSGTLFAHHKMPLRTYLAAIAIFCNEVKGKSALALSRDLDVQYKTAFVLAHKLREAMASDPVVKVTALAMFHMRQDLVFRRCVTLELVGDDYPRGILQAFQQLAKEALSSFGVTPALHQHIKHMAVLIDGTPKIVPLATDAQKHLIHDHLSPGRG